MIVRDVRYIIKRIVIGVGIALVLSFLRGDFLIGVSALSFPAPSSVQVTNNNNTQSIYNGNPSSVSWYSATGYSGANSPYQLQWNQGRFNFWYNGTLCQNKVVTAQVTTLMYSEQNYVDFSNSLFRLKVYNGESETACALNTLQQNSKVATWTCIFTNYSNSAFFVNNLTFNNNTFGIAIGNDSNYSCSPTTNDMIQSNQDQTNQIINSQNNNTTSIIQNNNSNTQTIINNQNENTEKEIESQKVCSNKSLTLENGAIDGSSGNSINLGSRKRTGFINVLPNKEYKVTSTSNVGVYIFEYDSNFTYIRYYPSSWGSVPYTFTTGINTSYIRFVFNSGTVNNPVFTFCSNGNQAIVDSQQDINNTLNDSNVDSASSQASNFFGSFTSNSHGLSGIITAPLRLVQSLSTATCNPLEFDLPFVEEHVVLPCMRGIYENYFGVFFSLWQLITTGVISYNICINLYSKVRNLQNPNNDRIEVLNL